VSGEERVHQVRIFGETYALRSADPPDYVQQVGQYVDEKFYDIAKGSPNVPVAKMGVLASLNIADELFRQQASRRDADAAVAAQVSELVALLEEGLEGWGPRAPGETGVAAGNAP